MRRDGDGQPAAQADLRDSLNPWRTIECRAAMRSARAAAAPKYGQGELHGWTTERLRQWRTAASSTVGTRSHRGGENC